MRAVLLGAVLILAGVAFAQRSPAVDSSSPVPGTFIVRVRALRGPPDLQDLIGTRTGSLGLFSAPPARGWEYLDDTALEIIERAAARETSIVRMLVDASLAVRPSGTVAVGVPSDTSVLSSLMGSFVVVAHRGSNGDFLRVGINLRGLLPWHESAPDVEMPAEFNGSMAGRWPSSEPPVDPRPRSRSCSPSARSRPLPSRGPTCSNSPDRSGRRSQTRETL